MSLLLFVYLYATVAFVVGGFVYYRGVLSRPLRKELEIEDRAVLSLAAVAVGVLWALFTPALLVLWSQQVARYAEAQISRIAMRAPRELRVRS